MCVCCTGWAQSKDAHLSKPQKDHFLKALFKALHVERPLLISASMSGSYVLRYMMLPDPETCSDRVSAFVPLAPADTPRFTHAQYHRCEVQIMETTDLLSAYVPTFLKIHDVQIIGCCALGLSVVRCKFWAPGTIKMLEAFVLAWGLSCNCSHTTGQITR